MKHVSWTEFLYIKATKHFYIYLCLFWFYFQYSDFISKQSIQFLEKKPDKVKLLFLILSRFLLRKIEFHIFSSTSPFLFFSRSFYSLHLFDLFKVHILTNMFCCTDYKYIVPYIHIHVYLYIYMFVCVYMYVSMIVLWNLKFLIPNLLSEINISIIHFILLSHPCKCFL